jgi:ABC-type transport system substrate-binding protein
VPGRHRSRSPHAANPGAYTNPTYDQLVSRLYGTIDSSQRDQIAAQLIKTNLEQMRYLPMTHSSDVSAARKELRGLTGVQPRQRVTAWNAHAGELN